jgi:hypothetical protein
MEMLDDAGQARERLLHCIENDTREQFATFEVLSPFLSEPTYSPQQLFQLEWNVLEKMIEKYYAMDEAFARQMLGRKFSSKSTKESLDDVSQKLGIRINSCLRQLRNMKRIYRSLLGEDDKPIEEIGDPVAFIKRNYLISEDLALKYVRIVFLSRYRFETDKKNLAAFSYANFDYFAKILIQEWSTSHQLEVDGKLLESFKEFKSLISSSKSLLELYKVSMEISLTNSPAFPNEKVHRFINSRFQAFVKSLCNLASKLYRPKDFKDVFFICHEEVFIKCVYVH